jgi:hypothetical protein
VPRLIWARFRARPRRYSSISSTGAGAGSGNCASHSLNSTAGSPFKSTVLIPLQVRRHDPLWSRPQFHPHPARLHPQRSAQPRNVYFHSHFVSDAYRLLQQFLRVRTLLQFLGCRRRRLRPRPLLLPGALPALRIFRAVLLGLQVLQVVFQVVQKTHLFYSD